MLSLQSKLAFFITFILPVTADLFLSGCKTRSTTNGLKSDPSQTTQEPPRSNVGRRYGDPKDFSPQPTDPGILIQGGGEETENGFRWMAKTSGNGDFVVLTAGSETSDEIVASGGKEDDGLDGWAAKLGFHSVQMFRFPSHEIPFAEWTEQEKNSLATAISALEHAEAVYFSGGNQHDYVAWPEELIAAARSIYSQRKGILSGSSAGMAFLGGITFDFASADAQGIDAIETPYAAVSPGVNGVGLSFSEGRLQVPFMKGILTDTHFHQRDRLGRLVAFMTKSRAEHALACDETTAVTVVAGLATLTKDGAPGSCFFFTKNHMGINPNASVHSSVHVTRLDTESQQFDLNTWAPIPSGSAASYDISVDGSLAGTKPNEPDDVIGPEGVQAAIYEPSNPYTAKPIAQ